MKTLLIATALLLSFSAKSNEGGIIEVLEYTESHDPCIFYKGKLCVLNEAQALESINNQANEDKETCVAYYKDKCILTVNQAKENYKAATKANSKTKRKLYIDRTIGTTPKMSISPSKSLENKQLGL